MKLISDVARDLGVPADFLRPYGRYMAKIDLAAIPLRNKQRKAKVILVTAMTPTPTGEGKTVNAIGLASALSKMGCKSVVCIRQPSMGPLFGIKGGATGGGRSTVEPMQGINLGFTGDIDAVSAAHNLLSAMLDNHLFHGNELQIDQNRISWNRTLDVNDRSLRNVTVRPSGIANSTSRNDSFVITAASEVMTTLSLSTGYNDLKERLGRIIIGFNSAGKCVTSSDLKAQGAMTAIMKEALLPNLAQTNEGTPALIHGGPFGNIATGTSSLASINLGLTSSEYLVIEAGFATDLGAEKFFDIVARIGNFHVDAVVIVASIKSIHYHSEQTSESANEEPAGKVVLETSQNPLSPGLENLEKHIENIRSFGILPVVALNRFPEDTEEEISLVRNKCEMLGVLFAVSDVFSQGAQGGIDLAKQVLEVAGRSQVNRTAYDLEDPIEVKIDKIVRKIYGGKGLELGDRALKDIETIQALGLERLPICMAKTALSLSDDPKKRGRPTMFTVKVSRVAIAAGAGFVIPYMGEIMTMPGLPKHPNAERIDVTDSGEIQGLF